VPQTSSKVSGAKPDIENAAVLCLYSLHRFGTPEAILSFSGNDRRTVDAPESATQRGGLGVDRVR
jgi:hypothetical protein